MSKTARGELVTFRPLTASPDEPISEAQRQRLHAPIVAGGIVTGLFVVGFFVWAALFSISGGVPAPGVVVVEDSRKTVSSLDGGIVRKVFVHEGERVKKGQVLFEMDNTQYQAQVDVLSVQYDSFLAQRARLEAQLAGQSSINWPPELAARRGDPRVENLIRGQETLFQASRGVFESQAGVLNQRQQQLDSRIQGLSAQVRSVDEQAALVQDELKGVNTLYEQGFAPKSRVLALQRSQAGLVGEKGARQADIASAGQAIGESRIQLAQLREQRATEAAETLRQVQVSIGDVLPRLRAAQAGLERTQIRSPADGDVLGMTQFTEGGVVRPGERMLDIVPQNAALVVKVSVRPDHIDEISVGMTAKVHLTAYSSRKVPPIDAKVITISADRITNDKGEGFFVAELAADQAALKKLGPSVKLSPGMPASAMIVTGKRTVLHYLISPFEQTFEGALHEN
jgi:HlyD family type I secretion membrane fusion protein